MSEHRRKQQSGRGDSPAGGGEPQGGRRAAPSGSQSPGGPPGQRRTARPQGPAPSAEPRLTRAEMRKAAQSKGKRGGTRTANGPADGGRGPSGPRPKRFLDYPRWGKRGVWRWLPSWKQILSGFLLVTASVVGLIGYAYAKTTVPSPNAITAMQSNTYYWADGTEMARRGAYYRQNVPLTQVPVQVQNDFLAAENASFWTDSGVDPQGILRAIYHMAQGGEVQSGSTITQQWIKNTRLSQSQTVGRKFQEILMSIKVGTTTSKSTILDGYLNTSYFGRGAYGIDAAAETYYGVSVDKLSISQGAFLTALVNGPSLYDPYTSGGTTPDPTILANAKARWTYVIQRMGDDKFIPVAQAQSLLAAGFPMPQKPSSDPSDSGYIGYLVTLANNNLLRAGVTQQQLDNGGYAITTTFVKKDIDAMKSAVNSQLLSVVKPKLKDTVQNTSDTTSPDYMKTYPVNAWLHVGGASVVPGNGAVTAIYGGPDYMQQATDDADNPGILVGSTFKAFVLAAALEYGVQPANGSTTAPGTPVSLNSLYNGDNNRVILNPNGTPWLQPNGKDWVQPNDDDTHYGPINLKTAMAQSVNTVYVQLGMNVGMKQVQQAALQAGLSPSTDWGALTPSFALGTSTPGPIRMAAAYATFANSGVEYDPYEVDHYTFNGQTVSLKSKAKYAFSPQVANSVLTALKAVTASSGTGSRAGALGWDVAGKTGTTDSYKSAWFVGFTKTLSTAIALFDQNPKTYTFEPLIGLDGMQNVYGADFPTEIWVAYMKAALAGSNPVSLPSDPNYGTVQNEPGVSASPSASTTPSASAPVSAPASHSAPPSPSLTPSISANPSPSDTSAPPCTPAQQFLTGCTPPASTSATPSSTDSSSLSWGHSNNQDSNPGG